MAVKFFGQFLLEQGAVSNDKLLQAIDLQEKTNLKFGEMALSMGLITEAGIDKVHLAQQREDLRFGDMALKLGVISAEQMQQVLTKQKNSHLYIGEALIEVGALEAGQLEPLLAAFKADQAVYQVEKVSIPAGVPSPEIWEMFADITFKMLTRVADIAYKAGPSEVVSVLGKNDVVAVMAFNGTVSGRYFVSVSSDIQRMIARAILREEDVSGEPAAVLDDTVMEFANIAFGNIAAKAAQMGQSIEISPPEVFHGSAGDIAVPPGQTGLRFPIFIADGKKAEMAVFIQG